ncbi:hypothetical protein AB0L65_49885 [Nonomuraea sp. NPDC052116]|uniref:hypothetical protein n=1 Tax=Nonomuraea sp. NPDC052116 TaxID=3155665 RepID=UPI0034325D53
MFALIPAENGVRAPDPRDALEVIKRARAKLGADALLGADTVLTRALPGHSVGALTGWTPAASCARARSPRAAVG